MKVYILFLLLILSILEINSLKITKRNLQAQDSTKNPKYIITSVLSEPFLKLKDEGSNLTRGNENFEGYIKDLATILAKKLKFDYELRLVKDSFYGIHDRETGQWNGMIGELIRQEADMAMAPLTITYERQQAIDFTIPFMTTSVSVMIKRPSFIEEEPFSFLAPFTKDLWLSIVFSFVGVAIVIFVVNKFNSYDRTEGFSKQTSENNSLNNKILKTLRAIVQQQNETGNRSISKRVVECVFWFFVAILIASYAANLSLFLSGKRSLVPVQNVEELSKQSDVQFGLIKRGSTQAFFRNSKSAVNSRIWNEMLSREDSFVSNSKEGIEKVRNSNGKFAFLFEGVVNDYANQQLPCDTVRLQHNFNSVLYGIAVAKGQPLKSQLDAALIILGNDGTLSELQNKWWFKNSQCGRNRDEGVASPLTLWRISGLFYLLIAGLILSLLIAVSEYCFKSTQKDSGGKGELLDKSQQQANL